MAPRDLSLSQCHSGHPPPPQTPFVRQKNRDRSLTTRRSCAIFHLLGSACRPSPVLRSERFLAGRAVRRVSAATLRGLPVAPGLICGSVHPPPDGAYGTLLPPPARRDAAYGSPPAEDGQLTPLSSAHGLCAPHSRDAQTLPVLSMMSVGRPTGRSGRLDDAAWKVRGHCTFLHPLVTRSGGPQ